MHSSPRVSPVIRITTWINSEIAALYPGCFALVMATGIISNALFFEGYRGWADALFVVNLVAYPVLVIFTVLRFISFSRALWADLINPRLVFSFFTIVAATDVFGIGINLRGFATVALLMWLIRARHLVRPHLFQLCSADLSQYRPRRQRRTWRLANCNRRH